jgi:hypothetical protein
LGGRLRARLDGSPGRCPGDRRAGLALDADGPRSSRPRFATRVGGPAVGPGLPSRLPVAAVRVRPPAVDGRAREPISRRIAAGASAPAARARGGPRLELPRRGARARADRAAASRGGGRGVRGRWPPGAAGHGQGGDRGRRTGCRRATRAGRECNRTRDRAPARVGPLRHRLAVLYRTRGVRSADRRRYAQRARAARRGDRASERACVKAERA